MKTLKRRGTVWPATSFKSTVKARRSATWWFQISIPRRCLRCLRCRNRLQDCRPSTALAHGPPQSVWKDQFTSQHIVQKPVPQRCFTFHWIVVLLFPGLCCGSIIWLLTAGNKLIFHRLVPLRWLPAVKAFFLLADLTNAIGLTLVRSMRLILPTKTPPQLDNSTGHEAGWQLQSTTNGSMPLVVAFMVGRERQRQWSGWKLSTSKTSHWNNTRTPKPGCGQQLPQWTMQSSLGVSLVPWIPRDRRWVLQHSLQVDSVGSSGKGVARAGAGMVIMSHGHLLVFGGFTWHNLKTLQTLEDVEILPSTNAVNTSFLQAWRKHLHGKLMMQRRAVKLQNSDHTMDEIFLVGGLRNASDAISASGRVEVWSVPNLEGTPAYGTASINP